MSIVIIITIAVSLTRVSPFICGHTLFSTFVLINTDWARDCTIAIGCSIPIRAYTWTGHCDCWLGSSCLSMSCCSSSIRGRSTISSLTAAYQLGTIRLGCEKCSMLFHFEHEFMVLFDASHTRFANRLWQRIVRCNLKITKGNAFICTPNFNENKIKSHSPSQVDRRWFFWLIHVSGLGRRICGSQCDAFPNINDTKILIYTLPRCYPFQCKLRTVAAFAWRNDNLRSISQ